MLKWPITPRSDLVWTNQITFVFYISSGSLSLYVIYIQSQAMQPLSEMSDQNSCVFFLLTSLRMCILPHHSVLVPQTIVKIKNNKSYGCQWRWGSFTFVAQLWRHLNLFSTLFFFYSICLLHTLLYSFTHTAHVSVKSARVTWSCICFTTAQLWLTVCTCFDQYRSSLLWLVLAQY